MASIDEKSAFDACSPHLHCFIAAGRGQMFPIRRPRYTLYGGSMTGVSEEQLSSIDLPYLYLPVLPGGGQAFPIWRPRYTIYRSRVRITIGVDQLPSAGIPHLHRSVSPCGGETVPIRRPGHAPHNRSIARASNKGISGTGVPDPHYPTISRRSKPFAIR